MDRKNRLDGVIMRMPASGVRLARGLAIRQGRAGNFNIMAASRDNVMPSDAEMSALLQAIKRIHGPAWIFLDEGAELEGGRNVFIRRLYWPASNILLVHAPEGGLMKWNL